MKKKIVKFNNLFILSTAIFMFLVFIILGIFYLVKKRQVQKAENITVKVKPTVNPSLIPPVITEINATTKKVTFPAYGISFNIINSLKYNRSINNFVEFVSSDYEKNYHSYHNNGLIINFNIYDTWKGFIYEGVGDPEVNSMLKKVDNSIIPSDNMLFTSQNSHAYSWSVNGDPSTLFPPQWIWQADLKLDTSLKSSRDKKQAKGIGIHCQEAKITTPFNRCREVVRTILSTLHIEK